MSQIERTAVYAGTFDPITNGHLWMIDQGRSLFDHLIVAIGVNPDKQTWFSVEERMEMLRKATASAGMTDLNITSYTNLYLLDFALLSKAKYILRGIRNEEDFRYELLMSRVNLEFNENIIPQVITVFLTPPPEVSVTSSSLVKKLVGPDGWEKKVARHVPDAVLEKLKERHYA